MLKQRVLTAIPLAILVIWGILTQPAEIIFYALSVILAIAGWEWARLSGIQNPLARIVYAVIITLAIYFSYQYLSVSPEWLMILFAITGFYWLAATYHMFMKGPKPAESRVSVIKLFIGFIVLIPPLLALMHIREQGAEWLFFCLSIIWVADIGAYFSGKRFGKNKLAVHLSPGKTREGFYGAVFATSAYSFFAGFYFELQYVQIFMLLIIAALGTFISVVGDLFISLLKREQGLKDTGAILPGHGGILDRIDSVTSSAPLFALLLGLVIFNG